MLSFGDFAVCQPLTIFELGNDNTFTTLLSNPDLFQLGNMITTQDFGQKLRGITSLRGRLILL